MLQLQPKAHQLPNLKHHLINHQHQVIPHPCSHYNPNYLHLLKIHQQTRVLLPSQSL
ncbi:hypothetical protein HanIR_Chr03g0117921 [Helianthus annuus]|nr:hypothetical protein HanIR_Chr03g0117921 [Helianthus annuus]